MTVPTELKTIIEGLNLIESLKGQFSFEGKTIQMPDTLYVMGYELRYDLSEFDWKVVS